MAGTRMGVIGCGGRMGRMLLAEIAATEGCALAGGCAKPGSGYVNQDIGELAGIGRLGISVGDNAEKLIRDSDVVIEFTTPAATAESRRTSRRVRKADSDRHHGPLGRRRAGVHAGGAQSSDRLGTQYELGHQSAARGCRRGRPPARPGLGRRNHGDAPSGQGRCAVGHRTRPRSCGSGGPQGDVRRSSAAR